MKKTFKLIGMALSILLLTLTPFERVVSGQETTLGVPVTVDLTAEGKPISPLIYGSNQDLPGVDLTFRRLGGNRTSGYNWETNASNAGHDWYHYSDDWLCVAIGVSEEDCQQPAGVITTFHDQSLAMKAESVITLQMAGYVSGDMNLEVYEDETAPSDRWVEVFVQKPGAITATPDLTDNAVYMDELVHYLMARYGNSTDENGIMAYALDNEPGLWASTHPRIHPEPVGAKELIDRSVALGVTVKDIDPNALIFGPQLYGFNSYLKLQDAPDWGKLWLGSGYDWFIDYYLDQFAQVEEREGRRILDVFTLNYYSEAQGTDGYRVVMGSTPPGSAEVQAARVQAPRSLWDSSFREISWIKKNWPTYLPLLPKVKQSIETYYPGTKLAITEWGFGGEGHITGGIAAADVLGIFGQEGLFAATHWSTEEDKTYLASVFNLYLNYDGQGGQFGNVSYPVSNLDYWNVSAYAAADSENEDQLHVILINKNLTDVTEVDFSLQGENGYTSAQVWGFDGASAEITQRDSIYVENGAFNYEIPPATVLHLVFTDEAVAKPTPKPTATEIPTETPIPTMVPTEEPVDVSTTAPTVTLEEEDVPVIVENEGDTIEPSQSLKLWMPILGAGLMLLAGARAYLIQKKKK
jgi:hypothetical protein